VSACVRSSSVAKLTSRRYRKRPRPQLYIILQLGARARCPTAGKVTEGLASVALDTRWAVYTPTGSKHLRKGAGYRLYTLLGCGTTVSYSPTRRTSLSLSPSDDLSCSVDRPTSTLRRSSVRSSVGRRKRRPAGRLPATASSRRRREHAFQ